MRSHQNEAGHVLLAVSKELITPLRNALQKLAGGLEFSALEEAEQDSVGQVLRHLWNPGEETAGRDRTVPMDVLGDGEYDELEMPPPVTVSPRSAVGRIVPEKEARPATERDPVRVLIEKGGGGPNGDRHEREATRDPGTREAPRDAAGPTKRPTDGYRPPVRGRHNDASR